MIVKGIIEEDFINYHEPVMTIEFPRCTFKCNKEYGNTICQNGKLAKTKNYDIDMDYIIQSYLKNDITKGFCFQGLDPFDTPGQMIELIQEIRKHTDDIIIIWTGYNKNEIQFTVNFLAEFYKNIIIKFGRYIPNQTSHYDEILGINLASNNQYAERVS